MTKDQIREFALGLGVDDVGFASAADYKSPRSPALQTLLPDARSLIVLAYGELSTCGSASPQIAMNGRLDVMQFSRSVNYRVARHLERAGFSAVTVPASYPLEMSEATKGSVGDVSLRHAAVAAGLGTFGRHNIVIHPKLGTRVVFTAVLANLELASDPAITEDLCLHCDACVDACPAKALSEEGKTDVTKCLKNSQPYGIGGSIRFWSHYADATPEARKAMLKDTEYWKIYQAGIIGFQYFCFNCMKSCPVGQTGLKKA